jgi:hypothetical protein
MLSAAAAWEAVGMMTPHVIITTTNDDAERPRISLPRAVPLQKGDAIEGFAEGQPSDC